MNFHTSFGAILRFLHSSTVFLDRVDEHIIKDVDVQKHWDIHHAHSLGWIHWLYCLGMGTLTVALLARLCENATQWRRHQWVQENCILALTMVLHGFQKGRKDHHDNTWWVIHLICHFRYYFRATSFMAFLLWVKCLIFLAHVKYGPCLWSGWSTNCDRSCY